MEIDSPRHAERQHLACGNPSPRDHRISFKTSTFHLQQASGSQKPASPGERSRLGAQASTSGIKVIPRIAATSFSLLDESSTGALPSTTKELGHGIFGIPPLRKSADKDINLKMFSLPTSEQEPGVVPFIAVGSVFSLIRQRVKQTPRGIQDAADLWHDLRQTEHETSGESLLDLGLIADTTTFLGPQVAFQGGRVAFWLTRESLKVAERSRDVFGPGTRPAAGDRKGGEAAIGTVKTRRRFFTVETPLVQAIRLLSDRIPLCGFQLEPNQERVATATQSAWQRAQRALRSSNAIEAGSAVDNSGGDASTDTAQWSSAQEPESGITRRDVPVFRLPGIEIRLFTVVGSVSFTPLFLSKRQLESTWAAIRAAHLRHVMRQRRSERRELRHDLEGLAARMAGVRVVPALPPAAASAAWPGPDKGEEGMDEPSEAKQPLQELGEGSRPAQKPNLPKNGLPMGGVSFVLASCAIGMFSLGMRCFEHLCNQRDRVLSLTPQGRQNLDYLPDPAVSVYSLGALAERANAQNMRVLSERLHEGAFGTHTKMITAPDQKIGSSDGNGDAESAAGEEFLPGPSTSLLSTIQKAAAQHEPPEQCRDIALPEAENGGRNSRDSDAAQHTPSPSVPSDAQGPQQSSSRAGLAEHAQDEFVSPQAGAGAAAELPDTRLDWEAINISMWHQLIDFFANMTDMLPAGTTLFGHSAVPALRRPNSSSSSSAGHEHEQDSGTDSGAPDAVSNQDIDGAIVPFQEAGPGGRDDAAADAAQQHSGDLLKVIYNPARVAGLVPADREDEKDSLKGLLLIGHLDIDPKGRELPSPLPAIGVGNGARLALADLRCPTNAAHDKAG